MSINKADGRLDNTPIGGGHLVWSKTVSGTSTSTPYITTIPAGAYAIAVKNFGASAVLVTLADATISKQISVNTKTYSSYTGYFGGGISSVEIGAGTATVEIYLFPTI